MCLVRDRSSEKPTSERTSLSKNQDITMDLVLL